LRKKTQFTSQQIELLFNNWKKQSSKNAINREQFESGLKQIGFTDSLRIEQMFSAFDQNKDGEINFQEFVTSLSVVQHGSSEDRLKFMFRAYDTDGNGSLSQSEVFNLIQATCNARGQEINKDSILKLVSMCFAEADENGDGEISFEEFKKSSGLKQIVSENFLNLPISDIVLMK